ncbi:MAG: PEP-CTERM sorting domain-containing protein [Vicinamibacteria bacterium]
MRSLPVTVVLALFPSLVHAIPCQVGSLQSYIDLGGGGCSIEDKLFSSFLDLGVVGDAASIVPADILVIPLSTPGNPGLTFDLGVSATAGELLQSLFSFSVVVLPGGFPIQAVSSSLSGSRVAPDGANTALFCLGTNDPTCPAPDTILLFDIGIDSLLSDSRSLASVAALDLVVDVVVDGGLSGSGSLSSATIRFREVSAVPEPATWLSVGVSLLALSRVRRQRRHASKELAK